MVAIAQLVEHLVVVQGVMGSIPISYPKYGEMAELVYCVRLEI